MDEHAAPIGFRLLKTLSAAAARLLRTPGRAAVPCRRPARRRCHVGAMRMSTISSGSLISATAGVGICCMHAHFS
eukprot:80333-Chlamydomonas_euryale.AAC.5